MNQIGVMGLPGGSEIILIIFVILLLFGAKKLPELSRSLGKSLGEFKKGQQEGETPDDSMSVSKRVNQSIQIKTDLLNLIRLDGLIERELTEEEERINTRAVLAHVLPLSCG